MITHERISTITEATTALAYPVPTVRVLGDVAVSTLGSEAFGDKDTLGDFYEVSYRSPQVVVSDEASTVTLGQRNSGDTDVYGTYYEAWPPQL